MSNTNEMTSKQKKQLETEEFQRKYARYWMVYWGLFFTAALSFICGAVLPFMRQDVTVELNWGTGLISAFYALGFLTIGEGAFNFWFDKVTDSDPDNDRQKKIAGVMIGLSALVSLSTALATSYIVAWYIKVFDSFLQIPVWAQKYIAISIPFVIVVNVVAGVWFKWESDEAYSERETNAIIRDAKNNAIQSQAKARAAYYADNAPRLARQMGEIEAQDQLDALQAKINEKRKQRGQTLSQSENVRQPDEYAPYHPVRMILDEEGQGTDEAKGFTSANRSNGRK